LVPNSRHQSGHHFAPLRAKSRLMHRSKLHKPFEYVFGTHRLDLDTRAPQVSGHRARLARPQTGSLMAFVQFTQPDGQPIVINMERIVAAAPLPDGQGTRITFTNGGHHDVKELIADVLRRLNNSA
jgi:uncharacterized protein YlzI (FlbEa/FlbD family)